MRFFSNDTQEKFVMSSDGRYLGQVDNLVVDTNTGKVLHILVIASDEVDPRKFRQDSQDKQDRVSVKGAGNVQFSMSNSQWSSEKQWAYRYFLRLSDIWMVLTLVH